MIARFLFLLSILTILPVCGISVAHAKDFTPPASFTPVKPGQWLAGSFRQNRYLSGFDQPIQSMGQYWYHPDHGLIWQVTDPFPSVLVMQSDKIVEIDAGQARILIGNQSGIADIAAIAGQSLSGDWTALGENFDITAQDGDPVWQFRLQPKQDSMTRFLHYLQIGGDRQVNALTIHKTGGDRDELLFTDQHASDAALPDSIRQWFEKAGAAK